MRKPPEIVTTAARISRLRHTKSTERAQAGGVDGGVESEKREALIWLSRAFRVPERPGHQLYTRMRPIPIRNRGAAPTCGATDPTVPENTVLCRAQSNDGVGQSLSMLTPALAIFFTSGFAALVYQVVWQRMLVIFSGADVHSATIVVAAFMAGLGCGSVGRTRRRPRIANEQHRPVRSGRVGGGRVRPAQSYAVLQRP